jgi:hypothetical protein
MSDDFKDLSDLLDEGISPPPPAAKKAATKKAASNKETSETLETSEPEDKPKFAPAGVTGDLESMTALMEEMQRTIAAQAEQIAALRQQPTAVTGNFTNPGEIPAAVLANKAPNQVNYAAILSATQEQDTPPPGGVRIHFLADGFTLGAKVFYRGMSTYVDEELAGLSAMQQRLRYGQVMFAQGPWPGESYDLDDPSLNEDDRQKLARIVAEQQGGFADVNRRLFEAQRR